MELVQLIGLLIVIGVLLWLVNTYGGRYIDAKILGIINAVVVIAVVLFLLGLFFPGIRTIRVGQ